MNALFHDPEFADFYEDTYYNAILGDVDLDANNFTYTNALDSSEKRYAWHGCPCCVGNIPRALLEALPTWMYSTGQGFTLTLTCRRGQQSADRRVYGHEGGWRLNR